MDALTPLAGIFEEIFALDVVFQPDCWKLCGDAHCCSFSRHKARFRMLGRMGPASQVLPLLPGEYDFLTSQGWTAQFQDHERSRVPYDFGPAVIHYDTLTSTRPHCACDHDTRTTVCRLYPLLPVFDEGGKLTSAAPLGVYEELEILDELKPACELTSMPFPQLNLYLQLAGKLSGHPVLHFHLMAYELVKRHVATRIGTEKEATGRTAFACFETAIIRRRLFDHETLKSDLADLYGRFVARHGASFSQALANI